MKKTTKKSFKKKHVRDKNLYEEDKENRYKMALDRYENPEKEKENNPQYYPRKKKKKRKLSI